MNYQKIVSKLHEYYEARDRLKTLRLELAAMAVDLGADQKEATKGAAPEWLDGFLVANGFIPTYRDSQEQAA